MPVFKYKFIKPQTGRQNSATRYAYDEAALRAELAEAGIPDLISVEELPPERATDRQVEYLRDLGVSIPPVLTKAEASDLITNATKRRSPMDGKARTLAEHYKVEVSRFMSKQSLYSRIASDLRYRNDPSQMAEWFVYRVYRGHFDRTGPGIESPADARLREIAKALAHDPSAFSSLRRAYESTEHGFRWFGPFNAPDGYSYDGDSRRTACFKFTHERLIAAGLLVERQKAEQRFVIDAVSAASQAAIAGNTSLQEKKGCLGSLLLICFLPAIFLVFALH